MRQRFRRAGAQNLRSLPSEHGRPAKAIRNQNLAMAIGYRQQRIAQRQMPRRYSRVELICYIFESCAFIKGLSEPIQGSGRTGDRGKRCL